MKDKIILSQIPAPSLIAELVRRGGEYVEGGEYSPTQVSIKGKYTKERSEKRLRKVLILDHLDFK